MANKIRSGVVTDNFFNAHPRNPDASLDLADTNKGFMTNRVNNLQMISIQNPVEGMMVYNTEQSAVFVYRGQNEGEGWQAIAWD